MIRVRNILHPSDLSEASEIAFAHALRVALTAKARLSMLHISPDPHSASHRFPGVRETLVRWGVLPADCDKDAVTGLGIQVRKIVQRDRDPAPSVLRFLSKHPADLIVMATSQQPGRVGWLRHSVSEPIARGAGQMTLFVPHGVEGFVGCKDGSVTLRRVLLPVDEDPSPRRATEMAVRTVRGLGCAGAAFTLLHVGNKEAFPPLEQPRDATGEWKTVVRSGDVVEEILRAAEETQSDLLVMTTAGRQGILDALRGTTTEQVLRRVRCPLLAVPASDDD
ncbi:MAG TPA: universal stress protein [Verrucomicrobiota bacterium]|nr:universal stress protein [Verrucomicrobiota bacterium]HNU49841.1 universal stress protein [Verrucomicrobiota bacterium]